MRWSDDQTFKFVKLYLSQQCLWDINHEDYKFKPKKTQAYQQFAADLKESTGIVLNDRELKLKIKSLRSTYKLEIAKIKRSMEDSRALYRPAMRWFYEFYNCFKLISTETLDDLGILNKDEIPEANSQKVWVPENATNDPDFLSEQNNDYILILKTEPEDSAAEKRKSRPRKLKRKKIKYRTPSPVDSDRTCKDSMTSSGIFVEDEFDIYGKYIASQLRAMGLRKALKVQIEIQNLVSDARLSDDSKADSDSENS